MSDTASAASKKLKADNLTGGDGDDSSGKQSKLRTETSASEDGTLPLHLPPPIWGHVLDYLPYKEVRSALLISKSMSCDVVKYVQTIGILNGTEMDIPSSRRFPNVSDVNILCVVSFKGTTEEGMTLIKLHPDVLWKVVPFLSSFSKLRHVYVGGRVESSLLPMSQHRGAKFHYNFGPMECDEPQDNASIYGHFLDSFLGAIKTRLLPQNLEEARGLVESNFRFRKCGPKEDPDSPCSRCRDILNYFPVDGVIKSSIITGNFCLSTMDRCDFVPAPRGEGKHEANGARTAWWRHL
mmetsp:Transcript_26551/g.76673  ORF Transcript_26551/g.76673 Transcript_26551/m.76673 type:complete len:295 (+) Transcript_26551:150-1034(+)